MRDRGLELCAVLLAALCVAPALSSEGGNVVGAQTDGHTAFVENGCAACHGTWGQGSAVGARLARTEMSVEDFAAYLRAPAGVMPPYSAKALDDEAVGRIHAYLAAIPVPAENIDPIQK